ncbi:hypothetical protein N4T20_11485 [Flavobacterium sp. TR2]|uniref:hypothetical protein n=1 Tax=Flavobacterium sp. TR2 TaxID=2977321 RepID=UPI0021B0C4E0|nr:hypothetical protein [Flavobacterium sp. TR2]UWY26333.1 hypothetical protein N4T20_11485 [Flavobacterium sp. TR2]
MLLVCVLLITNCASEDNSSNLNVQPTAEAKSWFNNHEADYNTSILQYIGSLQWENAIVSDGKDGEVIEVPFTLKENLSTSDEKGKLYNDHHRLVFIKNEPNNFKMYYVQAFTESESANISDKNYSYYSIKDNFNGQIFIQDLSSNKSNAFQFKNGQKTQPSLTAKWREEYYDYTFIGYWSEGGTFSPIKLLYCNGGSGSDDGGPTYGGGPIAGGGGSGTKNPTETTIIIITDPSFSNNPCLASIFAKLGGSATFQKYLSNFDGNFSVANLKLSASSTISNGVNAETSPPSNYLIDISFNLNNLNRPGLDVARTFMHEMIHAEMFRKLLSLSSVNGEIDATKLNQMLTQHNYPGLYDYYTRYGVNGMQHEQMAAHYMDTIISFLRGYDSGLTQSQYEAIAWAGLKGTASWNALSEAKKQSITSTYNSWLSTGSTQCN